MPKVLKRQKAEADKRTRKIRYKRIIASVGQGKTLKQAAMEVGLSGKYANSGALTRTKLFREMFDKAVPDGFLIKKHNQLLNKQEVMVRGSKNKIVKTGEIDVDAVKAGLDMAYKLKKHYDNSVALTVKRDIGEVEDEIASALSEIAEAIR